MRVSRKSGFSRRTANGTICSGNATDNTAELLDLHCYEEQSNSSGGPGVGAGEHRLSQVNPARYRPFWYTVGQPGVTDAH